MRDLLEYRRKRERLKSELRARHHAAPDDFLTGRAAPPAASKTDSNPRAVWVTNVPKSRLGAHRSTDRPKGRTPNDDRSLAQAVYAHAQRRHITVQEAVGVIARWLARAESTTQKSARERINRALHRIG